MNCHLNIYNYYYELKWKLARNTLLKNEKVEIFLQKKIWQSLNEVKREKMEEGRDAVGHLSEHKYPCQHSLCQGTNYVESAHLCSAEEMKKAKAAYRDRLDLHSDIFSRFALYWTRNLYR